MENDPKIAGWKKAQNQRKRLIVVEMKVGQLPEQPVTELLNRHGVNYAALPARQQNLLRAPAVLALWWHLATAGRRPASFDNATQLMREVLKLRQLEAVRDHGIPEADVRRVLDEIVTFMDREGRLDAADALVSGLSSAVDALCSTGVCRRENARVTFVHQGYFDYLVAENVLSKALRAGIEPIKWVKANQSLFRRDQLRQLLNLLRDSDPVQHDALLRRVLLDADVRFHLKNLTLGLLSQSDPPLEHELHFMVELAEESEWWPHVQGTVLWAKLPWFDALHQHGHFSTWLSTWTDPTKLRALLRLFRPFTNERADAVDQLLAPYWNLGKPRADYLAEVFSLDPSDDSPAMADFRLKRIRSGEWQFSDIYLDRVAERHPLRVVPMLEAVFQLWMDRLQRHFRDPVNNELPGWPLQNDCVNVKVLAAIERDAVRAWNTFTPALRLLTNLRRLATRGNRSIDDLANLNWQLRHAIDKVRESLERPTVAAVEALARGEPDRLAETLLSPTCPRLRGAEHAVLTGLLATAESHADFVLSWLIARPARFRLGDGHDELYWEPARALIQRFSPHCSDALFKRLEAAILSYHDAWEFKSYEWQLENLRGNQLVRNEWGHAQNVLLAVLPGSRMSERARSVSAAWRAKFGDPSRERPTRAYASGGRVTSPIPSDRLMSVTDRHWLKIMRGDWPEREGRRWRMHGPDIVGEASVRHFAEELGNATRRDPHRFAALAHRMPCSTDARYYTSILHALSEAQTRPEDPSATEPSSEVLEAIIEHVGDCSDAGYVQAVCRLVESRSTVRWSDGIVQRIVTLVEHPEPADGTFAIHRRAGSASESEPDIAMTAINCVRGSVASAITHLLWTRPDAVDRLLPAAERLLNDAHPAVRHEALGACLPVLNLDKDLAVRLTIGACAHDDDRVLASHWLNDIIRYSRSTHFEQLAPLILRMVQSSTNDVAESGASWATAFWIDDGRLMELVNQCRAGSKAQRIGLVAAASDYFAAGRGSENLTPILNELFNDADPDVRSRATGVFRYNDVFALSQTADLAKGFVASRAFIDDPGNLLRPLLDYQGNIERYATVILESADRVSTALADRTRDMRQRTAFTGNELSTLLLRLYVHSYGTKDGRLQDQCLDSWDHMLRCRVGMTAEHLKQLDD